MNLLTVDQAAAKLHRHRDTVKKLAREGILPHIRLTPRVILFDERDLSQALERLKVRGPNQQAEPIAPSQPQP
jgi:excisionase family DNA binding protein